MLPIIMLSPLRSSLPIGILSRVWCLVVSIPDLCPLSYYEDLSSKGLEKYVYQSHIPLYAYMWNSTKHYPYLI